MPRPGGLAMGSAARHRLERWRNEGARLVFTNGAFDLIHRGHVEYLEEARALGDRLIVGVNTDASVRRLKGPSRPIVCLEQRVELLAALESVDLAIPFEEDTPERLIREVRPQVLVKGADWKLEAIEGRDFVESSGGRVERIRFREGLSTSTLAERIRAGKAAADP